MLLEAQSVRNRKLACFSVELLAGTDANLQLEQTAFGSVVAPALLTARLAGQQ
jgi:hypothetical protein